MEELPQIDTTSPRGTTRQRKPAARSDAALKIAAVFVFVVILAVWIGILISRQADRQRAEDEKLKQLQDSAWEGITPDDVKRWSKQ